jgi:hypothetical protein
MGPDIACADEDPQQFTRTTDPELLIILSSHARFALLSGPRVRVRD